MCVRLCIQQDYVIDHLFVCLSTYLSIYLPIYLVHRLARQNETPPDESELRECIHCT